MIQATVKKVWLCLLCGTLLSVGCTNALEHQTHERSEIAASNPDNENQLRDRIEQISRTAQGQVGVTATVLETGESVTLNGEQQFPMQSVYKFPIAMAVLSQVDRGTLNLDRKVRVETRDFALERQHSPIRDQHPQGVELTLAELLKYMVSESDNTACDVLLGLVGGPEVVTQYLRDLGINDMVVANTEREIGQDNAVQYRNSATPDAAVALLSRLHEGQGLSASSQALLLQWMTETPTGLKRIKGLLPEGTVVAHKTGTSGTVEGVTAATNDVGLVTLANGRHLAIAVFVSDSTADQATREAAIAQIARAAWDRWSQ
ncbi:class A beta-lactamase, subclass A2 [Desertifilum sp. FACHB-1129]|nr:MULTISPECIES: class A beta-lactamase, subclass A2 [Desertifilum]MBD2312051.1 class A beta-lactamase, subclass A2 [Desertifilum sp. FACHB-1129]MBD2322504.1 class A beta-lactamase, subclass A2 [Desertifilum sp. FACHB-866]MBD2332667.1 class A beta-lactamase, subclass A2 [Desertifilum sp. FACHB-868]MDA0211822.1 class A beta-lactamase, subclass A2 [Cyanobacteria bacterium FC1]